MGKVSEERIKKIFFAASLNHRAEEVKPSHSLSAGAYGFHRAY